MSFNFNYSVLHRFRHVFLSIASGIILALALPKPGWSICAWIGLVPLFIATRTAGIKRAALLGLLTGTVYYAIILYWLLLFGSLPWLALTVFQAAYIAMFAVLYSRLNPQRIGWLGFVAVPASWVVMQFLRTPGTYSFTWGSFAQTQANNLSLAQIASVTGPWGIDFIVCFASLAITAAIVGPQRRFKPLAVAALLVLAMWTFGTLTLSSRTPSAPSHKVAVVQGSVSNHHEPGLNLGQRSYLAYAHLSEIAARSKAELIVWPETAIPDFIASPGWQDFIEPVARDTRATLLIGGYESADDSTTSDGYNSLILFDKTGKRLGSYRKVHLVPFGEFVPFRDQLSFFLQDYGIRPNDVIPAHGHPVLNAPLCKIGTSICFESAFPSIARCETRDGAQLLCIVTNDQTLQRTQGPEQHLMMAKLRAIENRRFVLRAAGTGISAIIDPFGRVRHRLGLYRKGLIVDSVVPLHSLTLYTRLGDWLAYLCIAVTVACLFAPNRESKKSLRG